MKKGFVVLGLIFFLSLSFVSAGWFSDFWNKITGSAVDDPNFELTDYVDFWNETSNTFGNKLNLSGVTGRGAYGCNNGQSVVFPSSSKGDDVSLRLGSCSSGGGSVVIVSKVDPDSDKIILSLNLATCNGLSGSVFNLSIDGVDFSSNIDWDQLDFCGSNVCKEQNITLNDVSSLVKDGFVVIKISDAHPTLCDGDPQLIDMKVYSSKKSSANTEGLSKVSGSSISCVDSDGFNFSKKGSCTDEEGIYSDTCDDSLSAIDWYCVSDKCYSTTHSCKSFFGDGFICKNGACVKELSFLPIKKGWNLVGWPSLKNLNKGDNFDKSIKKNLVDDLILNLTNKENVISLWIWDSSDERWYVLLPDKDDLGEKYAKEKDFSLITSDYLKNLDDCAVWVHAKKDFEVKLPQYNLNNPDLPLLNKGWNFVSFGIKNAMDVSSLIGEYKSFLNSNSLVFNVLWGWDENSRKWNVSMPLLSEEGAIYYANSKGFGLLNKITPNKGYWVYVGLPTDSIVTPPLVGSAKYISSNKEKNKKKIIDGCSYLSDELIENISNLKNKGKNIVLREGEKIKKGDYFVIPGHLFIMYNILNSSSNFESDLVQIEDVTNNKEWNLGIVSEGKAKAIFNDLVYDVQYSDDVSVKGDEDISINFPQTKEGEELSFENCAYKNKKESFESGDTGKVNNNKELVKDENNKIDSTCSGCFYEGKCYSLGYVLSGKYCNDGKFNNQKDISSKCSNNFECKSNICISGECVGGNVWNKFIGWVKSLLGKENSKKEDSKKVIDSIKDWVQSVLGNGCSEGSAQNNFKGNGEGCCYNGVILNNGDIYSKDTSDQNKIMCSKGNIIVCNPNKEDLQNYLEDVKALNFPSILSVTSKDWVFSDVYSSYQKAAPFLFCEKNEQENKGGTWICKGSGCPCKENSDCTLSFIPYPVCGDENYKNCVMEDYLKCEDNKCSFVEKGKLIKNCTKESIEKGKNLVCSVPFDSAECVEKELPTGEIADDFTSNFKKENPNCVELSLSDHSNNLNENRINFVFSMDKLGYFLIDASGNKVLISNLDNIKNLVKDFENIQPYGSYLNKFNFWVINVSGVDWYNKKYGDSISTLATPGAIEGEDFLWATDPSYGGSYEKYLGNYQIFISNFCPGLKKIQGVHVFGAGVANSLSPSFPQDNWGDLLIGDKEHFGVANIAQENLNDYYLFHEIGHSIGLVDDAYSYSLIDSSFSQAEQKDYWDLGNNVLKNSEGYYLGSNYKWGDLSGVSEDSTCAPYVSVKYFDSLNKKNEIYDLFRPNDSTFMTLGFTSLPSCGYTDGNAPNKYSKVVERLICRRLDSFVGVGKDTYCKKKYGNDLGCSQYEEGNSYGIDFKKPSEFMFDGSNKPGPNSNPYPLFSKLELLNCNYTYNK